MFQVLVTSRQFSLPLLCTFAPLRLCIAFFFISLLLTACNTSSPPISSTPQPIAARSDNALEKGPFIYQAIVPLNWTRLEVVDTIDTTKPIAEFYIQEEENIRITVHTFPFAVNGKRIPSEAQINRWKTQFEELDRINTHTLPDSHGGFSGLFFEGEGILNNTPTKVMGWSMQLAARHDRNLRLDKSPQSKYKRADYTIKASGSPHFMNKHRADLLAFAQSFELIEELPHSSDAK